MATTAIGLRAARELDELYRAHAAEVYRYVYAVLGNPADAEDVTQTTFVNALRALERGDRPRKPTNWLITIAHNLIRQRFRQQQSRPREVELDREIASVEADDDRPSIDDLVRALQRIPPSQREALVLRELEGRSYKEIAAIIGVSLTALETLIFRARRSLAEELENLVTCDRAELALSQQTDGRLGRKERKRLLAHLDECPSCARVAALGMKRRHAFKGLALLPLPLSLTLFKGAPTASAAIGLPAIGVGAGTAAVTGGGVAGVIGTGVAAKVAVGVAAVALAGGAGYEGVQQIRDPATPAPAAKTKLVVPPAKAGTVPSAEAARTAPNAGGSATAIARRAAGAKDPDGKGRSATAPGRTKAVGAAKRPPVLELPRLKTPRADVERGKSAEAHLRGRPGETPATEMPAAETPATDIPATERPAAKRATKKPLDPKPTPKVKAKPKPKPPQVAPELRAGRKPAR